MLEMQNDEGETIKNEGNRLAASQQYAAAIEKYWEALDKDPCLASAWLNLGLIQKKLKKLKEAKLSFECALILDINCLEAKYNLADTLKNLNEADQARIVTKLLKIHPTDSEVAWLKQYLINSDKISDLPTIPVRDETKGPNKTQEDAKEKAAAIAYGLFFNKKLTKDQQQAALIRAADLGHPTALVLAISLFRSILSEEKQRLYISNLLALDEIVILNNIQFPVAKYSIISILLDSSSTPEQQMKGIRLANTLIDQNDVEGHQLLGRYYYTKSEYLTAKHHWEQGVAKENSNCLNSLGFYYEKEQTGEKDLTKAFKYYKESAKSGNPDSDNRLGVWYLEGKGGIPKNGKLAKFHFEHAIIIEKSMKNDDFFNGTFQKSIEQDAMFNLGRLYLNGCGNLKKDEALAVKTLIKATKLGHNVAPLELGIYFIEQKGDMQQGLHWLQRSAEMGNAAAIRFLKEKRLVLVAEMPEGAPITRFL